MSKIRPPFKIHGGKYYLSPWIISHFPPGYETMTYLEPYCGGASVFLNKAPSTDEALNDLNPGVIRILRALRDETKEFVSRLRRTKYCENTFNRALAKTDIQDDLEGAINEFILRRMSRGGLKKAFAWSDRERGGQPGDVNAWETMMEMLPLIADRLRGVHLFNRRAVPVIDAYNDSKVLVYCDPPYLPDTRESKDSYDEEEMDETAHIKLGEKLRQFRGKAIISGYPSEVYSRLYDGWRCVKKTVANHSSQQKSKSRKTECLWLNY